MPVAVTVKVFFEASHRLHNPERDAEWNRRVFGKCNNLHGHGHNYVLEVTVSGDIDPETGYLMDMKELKQLLHLAVVDDVDHRHLNVDVPWLEGVNPTSENLALVFFSRIRERLPEHVALASVTLHETERNSATYYG